MACGGNGRTGKNPKGKCGRGELVKIEGCKFRSGDMVDTLSRNEINNFYNILFNSF